MKVLLEVMRRYVDSVPKENAGGIHLILLRIVFLACSVIVGVLAGGVAALLVYAMTAGTAGNAMPALYTFVLIAAGCTLFGLYTALLVMSNRNR